MRYIYRAGEREYAVEVSREGDGRYRIDMDGVVLELGARLRGGALELDGHHGLARFWISRDRDIRWVSGPGLGEAVLERETRRHGSDEHPGDLCSPMPGKVVKVLVAAGDEVEQGATLIVVEAMKTELAIIAPRAGRVAAVSAEEGAMCDASTALVELEDRD